MNHRSFSRARVRLLEETERRALIFTTIASKFAEVQTALRVGTLKELAMAKSGIKKEIHRRVWRVTANAPQGEYIDPDAPLTVVHFDRPEPGWLQSSFDLSTGLEVVESEPDTLPAELFDELFKAGRK